VLVDQVYPGESFKTNTNKKMHNKQTANTYSSSIRSSHDFQFPADSGKQTARKNRSQELLELSLTEFIAYRSMKATAI
jgi:hypothetical protein